MTLTDRETWRCLHDASGHGLAGGRTYDAQILRCARKVGAERLLTLDRGDFERLDAGGIAIVVPGA